MFELVVVLTIIGVLAALWVHYSQDTIGDARKTALQIQSRNFAVAAANVRAQWMVSGDLSAGSAWVNFENTPVYVNKFGWPVATEASDQVTAQRCYQLWQVLLQNPAPASVSGVPALDQQGTKRYHISSTDGQTCRYQFITASQPHYFEYKLTTGQVFVYVP